MRDLKSAEDKDQRNCANPNKIDDAKLSFLSRKNTSDKRACSKKVKYVAAKAPMPTANDLWIIVWTELKSVAMVNK